MPIDLSQLGGGAKLKSQTFLSSGNFTVPDGVETVWVTMCGGGGSGGAINSGSSTNTAASGGGAGFFVEKLPVNVVPGTVIPVVVGAGGLGVLVAFSFGNEGGASSFGSYSVGGGLGGGVSSSSNSVFVSGGVGGANGLSAAAGLSTTFRANAVVGGGINFKPGWSYSSTSRFYAGGAGGAFGPGGNGTDTNSETGQSAAINSGAGGGGNGSTSGSSGAGGSGRVIVEWFE